MTSEKICKATEIFLHFIKLHKVLSISDPPESKYHGGNRVNSHIYRKT